MKFFTYFTVALPLVSAIAVPSPKDNQVLDTLDVLHELADDQTIDVTNAQSLEKKADVPGLNCGYRRAANCAHQAGGVLATCVWAAMARGRDMKENTKCIGALTAYRSNLPRDCVLCFSL